MGYLSLPVPARLRLAGVLAASVAFSAGFGTVSRAASLAPAAPNVESTTDPGDRRTVVNPTVVRPAVAKATVENASLSALAAGAWSSDEVRAIDARVFSLALGAARCAASSGAVQMPKTLTIIDYSKASTEPRMWVLDLATRSVLYAELVSHGQGSGGNFATKFSNTPDSHQTSLGLFVTEDTYVGRNGYSLRLTGLDHGFNDRARERAIVMHGAPYVNSEITKSLGRLGRSHGCPAVRDGIARELIDTVKGGSLVFSYYPDQRWLDTSSYLNCGN